MSTAESVARGPRNHPDLPTVDGRRARRDRNREKVVDALLDLYREGNIAPPISKVAERSGISHRSVFRYFADVDQLCRVAIERHSASFAHLVDIDHPGEGPLDTRIESLVNRRVDLYEAIAPVARVTAMRAPLQPVLEERLAIERGRLDQQVERQFRRELESMPEPTRTSVSVAAKVMCSIDAIEAMCHHRGLSTAKVRVVTIEALSRLFAEQNGNS